MKSVISKFCEEKGIPNNLKDAFSAYCRSTYSEMFGLIKNSDTAYLLVSRLTEDQLEDAWQGFTKELKKYLTNA